jgi:hypothetical protein
MARDSNPFLLPMIVIGGVMGLLAGYGLLTILHDGGFKKIEPETIKVIEASSAPVARTPKPLPPDDPPIRRRPTVEHYEEPEAPRPLPVHEAQPPKVEEKHEEPAAVKAPDPSAVINLDLEKPVTRAIAEHVIPADVLCDISFSPMMVKDASQANPTQHILVEHRLSNRDHKIHELPLELDGAGAAIDITMVYRSDSAVCEIRPKFSLPANGIEELTIDRQDALSRKLQKYLDDAKDYKKQLPGMNSEITTVKSNLAQARSGLNAVGSNMVETGRIRHSAAIAANKLARQLDGLERDKAKADTLIEQLPDIRKEMDLLKKITYYSRTMPGNAFVTIRFYGADGATIPAIVK